MQNLMVRLAFVLCAVLALNFLGGCAGDARGGDPWAKGNRAFYDFDDGLDRVALKPAADCYVKVIPKPVRQGLGNGFDNLTYPNVILNSFLQGKWDQGWSDAGRMLVNSTIGIVGIFDVASGWGMVIHDTDFGITLGKWGVQQGPYLVLPLFGPSTARDVNGLIVGFVTNPLFWVDMPLAATISVSSVQAVDQRARAESWVKFRDEAAIDGYAFTRDAYLQFRESQVHDGKPAVDQSFYDDDTGPATRPATRPTTPPATQPATSRGE